MVAGLIRSSQCIVSDAAEELLTTLRLLILALLMTSCSKLQGNMSCDV